MTESGYQRAAVNYVVGMTLRDALQRGIKAISRAPDNSMIAYRRQYLSDRAWYGLALIAAGLGSFGAVGGWWKVVHLGVAVVGALLVLSSIRRFWNRARVDDANRRGR